MTSKLDRYIPKPGEVASMVDSCVRGGASHMTLLGNCGISDRFSVECLYLGSLETVVQSDAGRTVAVFKSCNYPRGDYYDTRRKRPAGL